MLGLRQKKVCVIQLSFLSTMSKAPPQMTVRPNGELHTTSGTKMLHRDKYLFQSDTTILVKNDPIYTNI